jgi:hypothetical protein
MKTRHLIFTLALLAAPVAAVAQNPAGPPPADARRFGGPDRNPVGILLDQREELSLTTNQVTRLETIQAELERQNAPLIAQVGDLRPLGGGPRGRGAGPGTARPNSATVGEMRERRDELQPVMEQIRENNQAAYERALTVLTAEQREAAETLVRPGRRGPGTRGGAGGAGGPGRAPGAGQTGGGAAPI